MPQTRPEPAALTWAGGVVTDGRYLLPPARPDLGGRALALRLAVCHPGLHDLHHGTSTDHIPRLGRPRPTRRARGPQVIRTNIPIARLRDDLKKPGGQGRGVSVAVHLGAGGGVGRGLDHDDGRGGGGRQRLRHQRHEEVDHLRLLYAHHPICSCLSSPFLRRDMTCPLPLWSVLLRSREMRGRRQVLHRRVPDGRLWLWRDLALPAGAWDAGALDAEA